MRVAYEWLALGDPIVRCDSSAMCGKGADGAKSDHARLNGREEKGVGKVGKNAEAGSPRRSRVVVDHRSPPTASGRCVKNSKEIFRRVCRL
jgi:hypothetical protein